MHSFPLSAGARRIKFLTLGKSEDFQDAEKEDHNRQDQHHPGYSGSDCQQGHLSRVQIMQSSSDWYRKEQTSEPFPSGLCEAFCLAERLRKGLRW
jgi:hypothetical protein